MTTPNKNEFITNTLRLIFGNVGAQIINLLTIPIITRLYGPDSYGVLTLFLSVSSILVAISCLRLETAILLPEKTEDAFSLFFLCLFFVFLFTFFVGGLSAIINCTTLQLPESYNALTPYLYLVAGYIFLAGSYKAFSFIAVRQNYFTIQAVATVSNAGSNKLFSILYNVFFMDSPVGLIGGLIIGMFISCWMIIQYSLKELSYFIVLINLKSVKKNFVRYKSFVIYSGTAFLESFSVELLPLMLGFLFSPAIVGFVGLTRRLMQQPLGVIGNAISRSFFQKITEKHRSGNKYNTYVFDLFKHILIVTFIPVLLFSVISPEIFEVIFGVKWRTAGVYFSILIIPFLTGFLYRPFSIIFDVQEKQRFRFFFNILKISFNFTAIYCGSFLLNSPVYALVFYSVTNTFITFIIMFLLMKMSGVTYSSLFTVIIKQIFIGIFLIFPILYLKFYIFSNNMVMFSIIGITITGYLFYIFMNEPKLKMLFRSVIK